MLHLFTLGSVAKRLSADVGTEAHAELRWSIRDSRSARETGRRRSFTVAICKASYAARHGADLRLGLRNAGRPVVWRGGPT